MSALPQSLIEASPQPVETSFFLEGSTRGWSIDCGSVELFAVASSSGLRHHLARFESGAFLTGMDQNSARKIRLLVCPSTDAHISSQKRTPADASQKANAWMERVAEATGLPTTKLSAIGYEERQDVLLSHIATSMEEETRQEGDRLRAKSSRADQQLANSIHGLAIQRAVTSVGSGDEHLNSLARVCNAVAREMGITLALPATLEEPDIATIAQASGARARRVTLPGEWWRDDFGPAVGFCGGAPVALLRQHSGKYRAFDPSRKTVLPVNRERAADFSEHAYVFCRAFPNGSLSVLRLARFALRSSLPDFRRVLLNTLPCAVLSLLVPSVLALLFSSTIPDANRTELTLIGTVLAVSAISTALFTFVSNAALLRIENRAVAAVHVGIWDRLLRCPATFFRRHTSADLAMRSFDVDQIRHLMAGPSILLALSGCFTFIHVPLLFYFGGGLAIPALLFILFSLSVGTSVAFFQTRRERLRKTAESKVTSRLMHLVAGIGKLRVAGAEVRAFSLWAQNFAQQRAETMRLRKLSTIGNISQTVLPICGLAVVLGSWVHVFPNESVNAKAGAGPFLAFVSSFQLLLSAALQVGSSIVSFAGVMPLIERLQPILNAEVEELATKIQPVRLSGALQIKDVTFRYRQDQAPVLDGMSLRVEPGEFIAIVGGSGSGKSTLLRLLLGFETPEQGTVSYDGFDLRSLNVKAVRRQFGVVLQDGHILPGDIASAILGDTGLGLAAAWEAARLAALDEDIRAMPMGMHTLLSDGAACLSGGQRQRLLIARAVAKLPSILFLDEATSALDNVTQAKVTAALQRIAGTRIVIAHRLSTIRSADRIVVLENGRCVESGRYEDLVGNNGAFRRLLERQLA